MAPLANYLRMWDYASAARVDEFVANSENVQSRVWKTYRRRSEVIYPPVAVENFYNSPSEDYFLVVSELVAYKRVSDAVRYFSKAGKRLKIVGDGPEYRGLKKLAGGNIEFCGRVSDEDLRHLYARCRALLMPGEEDFGIVAVEALASGKPVIALGRGGVIDSVPLASPQAGFFYPEPGENGLETAIREFEKAERHLVPGQIRAYSFRFSEETFRHKMSNVLFDRQHSGVGTAVA
jgi:glycosyltransferase involved in cell wall biosynthesis